MGDIRFQDDDRVAVDGGALLVTGPDIMLDHGPRRRAPGGVRRALVHDFDDGLTLNWSEDYPNGVTIRGLTRIPTGLQVGVLSGTHLRCNHHDLHLDHLGRRSSRVGSRRALVHDFADGLTINWASDYPGGVTIRGNVTIPERLIVGATDVGAVIADLRAQIDALRARVAELEARS